MFPENVILTDMENAVGIIKKVNRLWQEGVTDITPSVSKALTESMATIEKHLPSSDLTLNNIFLIGRYLLDNATIIKPNKFKNSDDFIEFIID